MPHRFIGLDTETTGLDPHVGERVIEIGLVEYVDRRPTGRVFHTYLNPDRQVNPEAQKVHGLSNDFLSKHPSFEQVVDDFLAFVGRDELVIHNAEFDLTFLNSELARCGRDPLDNPVLDTLELVKRLEPGKRASLDAMADRQGVDRSDRTLHGALVDARLLCDIYVAMTRQQSSLVLSHAQGRTAAADDDWSNSISHLPKIEPSRDESAAHAKYLAELDKETKGSCVWLQAAATEAAPPSARRPSPGR